MESSLTEQTGHAAISDAVSKAEACDAAGDHVAAVNHLAAAAGRQDVEALTRLGKRLLVGDRAPLRPNDGARLLEDADRLGGGEAAALLAMLYATGVSRSKGLNDGLDKLVLAAERNWQPAQDQIRVLTAGLGVDSPGDNSSEAWRALADGIDLRRWQSVPAAIDHCASPLVRSFPEFVSASVCDWFIAKSRGRLTRALVYEALSKKTTVRDTRTNTAATFNLLDTDFVSILTQLRIAKCIDMPMRHLEPIAVLHYAEGEEITEHFDFVDPEVPNYQDEIAHRGQRVITFLVYLNEDYSGGETLFPELGVSHKGSTGEGMFFVNALADGSSDIRTLHAGRPPEAGEKWVISQFVRNRPTL